jgi:hypothetical protein
MEQGFFHFLSAWCCPFLVCHMTSGCPAERRGVLNPAAYRFSYSRSVCAAVYAGDQSSIARPRSSTRTALVGSEISDL